MELALALRYDEEDHSVSNQVPNVLSSGLNINLAGQPINPAYTQFPGGIPDCSEKFSEWQPKVTWRWATRTGPSRCGAATSATRTTCRK
jgi:iron complex outermembrane receptor protein